MLVICRSQLSRLWSFCGRFLGGSIPAATQTATGTPGGRVPAGTPMSCLLATVAASMFLTQGCGTAILASSWGVRPDTLSVGSGREEVEAKLGRPIGSRTTSDGGRVDTYDHRVYRAGKPGYWAIWIIPLVAVGLGSPMAGLWNLLPVGAIAEPFLTPYAVYKLATQPRSQVKIAFGPDDRLGWIGSPPPYGPPDAAVEPVSIGEIRERCRAQDDGEPSDRPVTGEEHLRASANGYVRCVTRRFAIWGIE